jgi:2-iminobutanoate/2-iminopropanoate deaminase
MPLKEPVQTSSAPRPGGPYSQGIVTGAPLLFVSGQGPVDPATNRFVTESFEQQARLALSNVKAIVEAAGGTLADVVRVGVLLSDMAHFDEFNAVYREFFPEPLPARTASQSALPGFDVSVEAVAALNRSPAS